MGPGHGTPSLTSLLKDCGVACFGRLSGKYPTQLCKLLRTNEESTRAREKGAVTDSKSIYELIIHDILRQCDKLAV